MRSVIELVCFGLLMTGLYATVTTCPVAQAQRTSTQPTPSPVQFQIEEQGHLMVTPKDVCDVYACDKRKGDETRLKCVDGIHRVLLTFKRKDCCKSKVR